MGKVADLSVGCIGKCNRTAVASIIDTDNPGCYGALPPDGWLINGYNNVLAFCCGDCAQRLNLHCGCEADEVLSTKVRVRA